MSQSEPLKDMVLKAGVPLLVTLLVHEAYSYLRDRYEERRLEREREEEQVSGFLREL